MSLRERLVRRIAAQGPISVATYMQEALLDPDDGYYATRDPFGAEGDFVTAPEISQMFGELVGFALAQAWLDHGAPARISLAELGPGRGTLMADVLRATQRVPGFLEAARIVLVEASPTLRALQATRLRDFDPDWIEATTDLPDAPLFLIANEFFDALPVRQFVRAGPNWRERQIGLVDGELAFGLSPAAPRPELDLRLKDTRDGDLVEQCTAGQMIAGDIGARIARNGGCALIVDYGDWLSLGDTLQAVRRHEIVDPLKAPGCADLTAHVDFEALARAAAPAAHTRLTPQGVFLERLGITARAQTLAEGMDDPALNSHIAAHRRLTHPSEMGNLFKVLGLYPNGANPPPGLEP